MSQACAAKSQVSSGVVEGGGWVGFKNNRKSKYPVESNFESFLGGSLPPAHTDHFRLHITGIGTWKISSLIEVLEVSKNREKIKGSGETSQGPVLIAKHKRSRLARSKLKENWTDWAKSGRCWALTQLWPNTCTHDLLSFTKVQRHLRSPSWAKLHFSPVLNENFKCHSNFSSEAEIRLGRDQIRPQTNVHP